MRVVIAGCGRVGRELALSLSDHGDDVTVVDNREEALASLGKGFDGATVVGQAYDVDTLSKAGLDVADAFAAVTDSDNANLMAVEVAKEVFGVTHAIARLYDPAREASYRALGIRHVTGTRLIAQVVFEQIVDEEFHHHVTFDQGDVEIVEFTLGPPAAGMTIEGLEVRNQLRVAAVRRGPATHIPPRGFLLQAGDLVVAAVREGIRPRIGRYLVPEEGG